MDVVGHTFEPDIVAERADTAVARVAAEVGKIDNSDTSDGVADNRIAGC